ncbi:MAG: choice-of-anchor E domain-containing protein [bacterium]|nr:choice-of-anchor E domain-containing protein [bacterium]
MNTSRHNIRLLPVLVAALCSAAPAAGQVKMPHTKCADQQEVGTNGWSTTLVFDRFDPLLGVLTEVEVILIASAEGELEAENLSPSLGGSDLTASLDALVSVDGPNSGFALDAQPNAVASPTHVEPFDGTLDYSGPSAVDWGLLRDASTQGLSFTAPADLAAFTASPPNTTFEVLLTATGSVDVQGSAGPSTAGYRLTPQTPLVGAMVEVVYHVAVELTCDTSGLPGECDLDCNSNGVPDDLDVFAALDRSPDCNSNGRPDECDLGAILPAGTSAVRTVLSQPGSASAVSLDLQRNSHPCIRRENDHNGNCVPDECD